MIHLIFTLDDRKESFNGFIHSWTLKIKQIICSDKVTKKIKRLSKRFYFILIFTIHTQWNFFMVTILSFRKLFLAVFTALVHHPPQNFNNFKYSEIYARRTTGRCRTHIVTHSHYATWELIFRERSNNSQANIISFAAGFNFTVHF